MMHDDDRFNDWLRETGQSYHVPPPTPGDEMWARITAERRRRAARRAITAGPWVRWSLAAAAVLAVGIAIGRWTGRSSALPDAPFAGADTVAEAQGIYRLAATPYLSRTEAFLTGFRADLRSGRPNTRLVGQARELLTTTRLMLDSPAAEDPRLRQLLEDLELVLVQISQLDAQRGSAVDLITQGMDQRNVLPMLRSAIPAGPVAVRTEGVL